MREQPRFSLRSWLEDLAQDEVRHPRWVNTLSYLEYIGCRKILKSQLATSITVEVLGHAAEEARHALFLKHMALKLSAGELTDYRREFLLAPEAADDYFQNLDTGCELKLRESYANASDRLTALTYLHVTWLIEVRALWVYREYQSVLRAAGFTVSLAPLLADEERHLADVEAALAALDPAVERHRNELIALEQKCFDVFAQTLSGQTLSVRTLSEQTLSKQLSPFEESSDALA